MNLIQRGMFLGVVAVILALLVWALWPAAVPSQVVEVRKGDFQEYIEEEGRTILRNPALMLSPVSGYLRRVELEAGDRFSGGEVLFRIEPMPVPVLDERARLQAEEQVELAEAQLAVAVSELNAAEAELRQREADLRRAEKLIEENVVTEAELDRAKFALERAEAMERAARNGVRVAEHQVRNAKVVLEVSDGKTLEKERVLEIPAQEDGVVLRRHRWNEGPVQAGELILEAGDLSKLEVRVDALSLDAVRISEGMRVELTRWGGRDDLGGRVRRVEPSGFTEISALGVEEQRVFVWVSLDEEEKAWEKLGDGYRVEARFILWEGEDVLQIPASSVFRERGRESVFVVKKNRVHLREVEVGRRSGIWVEILSGVEVGERVVSDPGDRLVEGSRVSVEIRDYGR